jgi:PhnB protein
MSRATHFIPKDFHSIVPALVVQNAATAIEYYKKAFGAEERLRMPGPDGNIMHAELKIGDSVFFLTEENPQMKNKSPQTLGGTTTMLNVYVPDVDSSYRKAIEAGGKEGMPVTDQFWGDRYGTFTDPFGYSWGIGTHKEDLNQQELGKRAQAFFASSHAQSQKKSA